MFEEPNDPDEKQRDQSTDPAIRAREKFDEFRMHAELAAVFEGRRKTDAELKPGLDPDIAREVQRGIAKLEKAKQGETPIIAEASAPAAAELLKLPETRDLSSNDYHIHRRPGETMI